MEVVFLVMLWLWRPGVLCIHHHSHLPNIVLIVADDLGIGDIKGFNPTGGVIETPFVDKMMKNGMSFLDAHSTSSVCSPSRYSLLTGRYNWRTRLQEGVLHGLSDALIPPDRSSIASILKKAGYYTACVGKWHVGMTLTGNQADSLVPSETVWNRFDFKTPIKGGPTSVGFDYYYGISASLDMPPYMFIENDRFIHSSLSKEKVTWGRQGPTATSFQPVDVLPHLVDRSQKILNEQLGDSDGRKHPLFLFLSLTSPHTPVVPNSQFLNQSRLGWYGDFVMQTDAAVGSVIATLTSLRALHNTLVIFTSDNGFTNAGYMRGPRVDFSIHKPSGIFRGSKADIYEGGHRIPLVMQWPAIIKPSSTVDETVSLADLFATFADIASVSLLPGEGEDSYSLLPLLVGKNDQFARNHTVVHSFYGKFAIREGRWLLAFCPGSGGWTHPKDQEVSPSQPRVQLFDLLSDPSQTRNLVKEKELQPLTSHLTAVMQQIKEMGSQRLLERDHSIPSIDWTHFQRVHSNSNHQHSIHNSSRS
jgi:arylsulfatase A